MVLLSSMEHRLETAKSEMGVEDPNDLDLVMKQRITLAKLEDTYYEENINNGSDDESDNDDDDENSSIQIDRRKRFRRAYEVALSNDTQGYQVTSTKGADRTARELNAISWAAFCTELLPEVDAAVRVQALNCGSLLDRLKLASVLLRRKREKLRFRMEKAGLKSGGDDFDEPSVNK